MAPSGWPMENGCCWPLVPSPSYTASSSSVYAFRTTFNPLMFALANKESQATYQFFFQHVVACGLQFTGVDLSLACRQYHADLHSGEDAAVKAIFVNADRVADWAHVMGACRRPSHAKTLQKEQQPQSSSPPKPPTSVYIVIAWKKSFRKMLEGWALSLVIALGLAHVTSIFGGMRWNLIVSRPKCSRGSSGVFFRVLLQHWSLQKIIQQNFFRFLSITRFPTVDGSEIMRQLIW